ncbi:hypothetical protein IAG25_32885 [Caballeronia sp. EK]|uniref:hypothetical protein n=1 Tax=Caballeronia sp. EK TaxID=2767469 RepID=UPI001655C787|nr:hypothetical protein [Caballeronia sp. EK]MBC8641622.1 hypothetical protein [Caballeronia sp. EK]
MPYFESLLDADIGMERIEQLHIQAGWSLPLTKAYFVSERFIEDNEAHPSE